MEVENKVPSFEEHMNEAKKSKFNKKKFAKSANFAKNKIDVSSYWDIDHEDSDAVAGWYKEATKKYPLLLKAICVTKWLKGGVVTDTTYPVDVDIEKVDDANIYGRNWASEFTLRPEHFNKCGITVEEYLTIWTSFKI